MPDNLRLHGCYFQPLFQDLQTLCCLVESWHPGGHLERMLPTGAPRGLASRMGLGWRLHWTQSTGCTGCLVSEQFGIAQHLLRCDAVLFLLVPTNQREPSFSTFTNTPTLSKESRDGGIPLVSSPALTSPWVEAATAHCLWVSPLGHLIDTSNLRRPKQSS